MAFQADPNRYATMSYSPCGQSGITLPRISLGLWHNFGTEDNPATAEAILLKAFDKGVTCFDLANNYGPPPGSAESTLGRVLHDQLGAWRDELIITTKAGHRMWEGPYGDGSSRKNLTASMDQSLKRLRLEYVDIFYSHRYDGVTPLEETLQTLVDVVKAGKALYVGLSKYPPEMAEKAYAYLAERDTPCLIQQDRYSLLSRGVEKGVLETAHRNGVGFTAFSPLAQGLLTNRYLEGVPADSRAARNQFLKVEQLTPSLLSALRAMNDIARQRGETLAQMALSWVLHDKRVTSVIIGASSVNQLLDNLGALNATPFEQSTLDQLDAIVDTTTKNA